MLVINHIVEVVVINMSTSKESIRFLKEPVKSVKSIDEYFLINTFLVLCDSCSTNRNVSRPFRKASNHIFDYNFIFC